MTISEKISLYMKTNNIKTLTEFASIAHLPYTTLKNLFIATANPSRDTLVKLKNAMGITLDELADDNCIVDFEYKKNQEYLKGNVKIPNNTIISIGRGGKRSIYTINDNDAQLIDNLLNRLGQKND